MGGSEVNTELLLSTLDAAGIDARATSGGEELVMDCPICDAPQKLYLNTVTGMWVCFKGEADGERGGLHKFLLNACGLEPFDAYSLSVRIRGRSSKTPSSAAQALLSLPQQSSQAPRSVTLPDEFVLNHATARRYLEQRGVDPALCAGYGIGYCPSGFFEGRVIVPVYTENRLLTFVARSVLPDAERKVLMPRGSDAKHALFNHASVQPPLCVLVEGVFDALKMPSLAIATLGAHLSEYQRRSLKRLGYTHVVLMRDGDQTGIDAAIKEALELRAAMFSEVHMAMLPRGMDPGAASTQDLEQALAEMRYVDVDYGRAVLKEVVAL